MMTSNILCVWSHIPLMPMLNMTYRSAIYCVDYGQEIAFMGLDS